MPIISRDARLVVWPGVGAMTANMNYVRMEPGEANVPHIHVESEDTIFILEGHGTVEDFDNGTKLPFHAGQAIHVPDRRQARCRRRSGRSSSLDRRSLPAGLPHAEGHGRLAEGVLILPVLPRPGMTPAGPQEVR